MEVSEVKCQDCGKPYIDGLKFVIKGNYIKCQSCYDEMIKERKRAFKYVYPEIC